ncbi:MAG TPA: hypothetical protein P5230_04060, partial [Candidatus Magasanikbacteria bacterium]|nr:hypothetical protein [Candidatus Magasanikbacteria bacterium]
SGEEKKLYGMSSENVEITFNGEGRLQSGEARVVFPTEVQELIDENQSIKVNVTLTSLDTVNSIAVINKDKTGFTVKELKNGKSDATFDWFVVAKRKIIDDILVDNSNDEIIEEIPTTTSDDTTPEIIVEPTVTEELTTTTFENVSPEVIEEPVVIPEPVVETAPEVTIVPPTIEEPAPASETPTETPSI